MSNKPFYIGWQAEMSPQHQRLLKRFLIPLFVLIPVLIIGVVFLQKQFNNHQFELGDIKEFTGVYHHSPYPILTISDDNLPKGISKSALLVGYGKFGAKGTIEMIEAQSGESFDNKKITIKGSLIYGDGKAVIELTEQENSLVKVHDERQPPFGVIPSNENITVTGEILDPKCYFGVMKPAIGKIHKSCAVRCISGGIPPVFRVQTSRGGYDYYLVVDKNGNDLSESILSIVAEEVTLTGEKNTENGWNVLTINYSDFKRLITEN